MLTGHPVLLFAKSGDRKREQTEGMNTLRRDMLGEAPAQHCVPVGQEVEAEARAQGPRELRQALWTLF